MSEVQRTGSGRALSAHEGCGLHPGRPPEDSEQRDTAVRTGPAWDVTAGSICRSSESREQSRGADSKIINSKIIRAEAATEAVGTSMMDNRQAASTMCKQR